MLISFSVENYLSIKDKLTLSMEAVPQKYKNKEELSNNFKTYSLIEKENKKFNLLKSAIIYGLNASGKSNLLVALKNSSKFIVESFEKGKEKTPFIPFVLNSETRNKPSEFEYIFLIDNVYYRYGFVASKELVYEEWLFYSIKGVDRKIFTRELNEDNETYLYTGDYYKNIRKQVRKNSLLLTLASLNDDETASKLLNFFDNIVIHDVNNRILPTEVNRNLALEILKGIDIGLTDLKYHKIDKDSIENELNKIKSSASIPSEFRDTFLEQIREELINREDIDFLYFDETNAKIGLSERIQSTGTKFFFSLISLVLNSYQNPCVILIDEIEESLHPMLLKYFFKLFQALPNNNIQLISTTHNITLLDEELFRRDQIYITDKNIDNATTLVSVSDFTGVRKGSKYLNQYLEGRFGGIPILLEHNINDFIQLLSQEEE